MGDPEVKQGGYNINILFIYMGVSLETLDTSKLFFGQ